MLTHLAVVCCCFLLLLVPAASRAAASTPEQLFVQSQRWLEEGEFARARDGFAVCWKEFAARHGEGHEATREARIFYGQLLTMTGRADLGLNVLGPMLDEPGRLGQIASGAFALALRQGGQPDQAVRILRKTLAAFVVESPEDYLHVGRFRSEIAVSLAYMRRYREAEAEAKEALLQIDRAGGGSTTRAHHPCLMTILGQIYLLSGRSKEAEHTLRAAEELARPVWNESHPEMAILQGALGMAAFRMGRYEEAERRTRSSLAAMEKLLGPDHSEVGMITTQLAEVLKKLDRKPEAKQLTARAKRILERNRPGQAPTVSAWSFRDSASGR